MTQFISFDMDGTLIGPEFTDWVWGHGIPVLYAEKRGLSFEEARTYVQAEYRKVGEGAIEWYDIKYWFRFFELNGHWKQLMKQHADKIRVYPDVDSTLSFLKERFPLVLTSNATREFIGLEVGVTGLGKYFDQIFSATSDFGEVKKTAEVYQKVCQILGIHPSELVHVGDHYEFDYLVPSRLGIHALYLDRTTQKTGESVLWNLKDLKGKV